MLYVLSLYLYFQDILFCHTDEICKVAFGGSDV